MDLASKKLLTTASKYGSPDEFKKKNLPAYLVSRKKGLLSIAFPPKIRTEPIKKPGIFYLYIGKKVSYIGYSLNDIDGAKKEYLENTTNAFSSSKVFYPISKSDTITVYHYLVAKYKPYHNKDVTTDILTVTIDHIPTILGKPKRNTLCR